MDVRAGGEARLDAPEVDGDAAVPRATCVDVLADVGLAGAVDVVTRPSEQGCPTPGLRTSTSTPAALGGGPEGALVVGSSSRPDGAALERGLPTLLLPRRRHVDDRCLHRVAAPRPRPGAGPSAGAR